MAWKDRNIDFRNIKGMDPAANWLLGAAAADYLPDGESTPVPFLLELVDDAAVTAFKALPPFDAQAGGNGALVLGFKDDDRIKPKCLLPVFASQAWFIRLLDDSRPEFKAFRNANKRIVLSSPVTLSEELLILFPDFPPVWLFAGADLGPPAGGWPDGTVLTAVIDDGIAFAHDRFRDAGGETRIQCFYDMNHLFSGHLVKSQIDADLATVVTGGVSDEDAIYRKRRLVDHADLRHKSAAWRAAHGTHVLDLAAGYDPSQAVANRPIIAVQLPARVVTTTTGELLDFFVAWAILYILHHAKRLAGPGNTLPLVINTSLGYIAEQRYTGGMLEAFMDLVVALNAPTTQIVLPAGNSHLSRCHAEINFSGGGPVEFDWIVQPNDKTHSWFVVLLPPGPPGDNRMKLTVTRPDNVVHTIEEIAGAQTPMGGDLGRMELVTALGGQRLFYVRIAPTERPQPDVNAIAPAGRWKLKFEPGPDALGEAAHTWVQRDDSIYGYPRLGRQSYFDHANYRRFDDRTFAIEYDDHVTYGPCPVTRVSLLNAIATGRKVITAGGFLERECRAAPYSAGGPMIPPESAELRKPDALLPSEGSKAHFGVLAAGSRSGSVVAMSGTSMAAPQLARYVAGLLEVGDPADRVGVKALAESEDVCPTTPLVADREGWGRLRRRDLPRVERYFGLK